MDEQPDEWIPLRQAVVEVAKAYAEFMLCQPAGALETAREAVLRALNTMAADARAPKWLLTFHETDEHPGSRQDQNDGSIIPSYFWGVYQNAETITSDDWVAGDFSFSWDGKYPHERTKEDEEGSGPVYAFGLALGLEVTRRGLPLIGNRTPTDETLDLATDSLENAAKGRRVGRPPKWDWEAALCAITAIANSPNGLPDGHGAQAEVGRMLSQWFRDNQDGEPAASEIGARAAKIMSAIDAHRK